MAEDDPGAGRGWVLAGRGCMTAVAGLFGGGMIGVFVAMLVSAARGCAPTGGEPACDWQWYWLVGMVVGVVTLPAITLWLSRRTGRGTRNPE